MSLTNWLEWLTELTETFYALDCQVIIDDRTQEEPDRREAWGKVWEKGGRASLPSLSTLLSPYLHVFANVEVLQNPPLGFYGGFIT